MQPTSPPRHRLRKKARAPASKCPTSAAPPASVRQRDPNIFFFPFLSSKLYFLPIRLFSQKQLDRRCTSEPKPKTLPKPPHSPYPSSAVELTFLPPPPHTPLLTSFHPLRDKMFPHIGSRSTEKRKEEDGQQVYSLSLRSDGALPPPSPLAATLSWCSLPPSASSAALEPKR